MKKRKIASKNYLILSLIFVSTILFTFYLKNWYITITEYNKNNTVVLDVVKEIEINTLPSFLLDNPEIVVYTSSSTDQTIKAFEKEFKKLIISENLGESIVFLNLNNELNKDALETIKKNYFPTNLKNLKTIYTPNLIYFNGGKVEDVLYIKNTNISKNDVNKFLKRIEMIEND